MNFPDRRNGAGNPAVQALCRYRLEFGIASLAYVVVIFASIHVLQTQTLGPLIRTLVAATPAVPMLFAIIFVVRFVNGTAALGLTYGFLENIGFPHVNAWWAFISIRRILGPLTPPNRKALQVTKRDSPRRLYP
ncbi:MAG: hypothetical protein ACXVAR_18365 [Vulcanimicrobiaceae bacterium]